MGIAIDVKKINNYLHDLYAGIAMDVKKNEQLFKKPICGYNIFEMALWKLQ